MLKADTSRVYLEKNTCLTVKHPSFERKLMPPVKRYWYLQILVQGMSCLWYIEKKQGMLNSPSTTHMRGIFIIYVCQKHRFFILLRLVLMGLFWKSINCQYLLNLQLELCFLSSIPVILCWKCSSLIMMQSPTYLRLYVWHWGTTRVSQGLQAIHLKGTCLSASSFS